MLIRIRLSLLLQTSTTSYGQRSANEFPCWCFWSEILPFWRSMPPNSLRLHAVAMSWEASIAKKAVSLTKSTNMEIRSQSAVHTMWLKFATAVTIVYELALARATFSDQYIHKRRHNSSPTIRRRAPQRYGRGRLTPSNSSVNYRRPPDKPGAPAPYNPNVALHISQATLALHHGN